MVARAELAPVAEAKSPELPFCANHHRVRVADSDIHHCVCQRCQLPRLENMIFFDIAVPRTDTISPAEERAAVSDGVRGVASSSDPHSNETIERRDPMRGVLQQQQRAEGRGTLAQNSCMGKAGTKRTDPVIEIAMT